MSASHGHDEPLPEPKTPMWLPAVGAVLFLTVAIWWAATPSTSDDGATTTTAASASAAAPTPPPAATPANPNTMQGAPRPGGTLNPGHAPPARRLQDALGPGQR